MTKTSLQVAAGILSLLAVAGLIIWAILGSIDTASYMAMNDNLTSISEWLLWIAGIGQTAFVLTWLSLPWYTHWVGRALMVKSLALAVYLDFALVFSHVDPSPALPLLGVILFSFITLGIWTQLVTIVHEISRGRS